MKIPALQPSKLTPTVDLAMKNIAREIHAKGLALQWERAVQCPCFRLERTPDGDAPTWEPDPDCPGCSGSKLLYHSPQEIRGVVHAGDFSPDLWKLYGEQSRGLARFTLLPVHLPSPMDRLTVLDVVFVFDEVRVRLQAEPEQPRFPVVVHLYEGGVDGDEETPQSYPVGVVYARRAGADGKLVAGELVEGVDFEVTEAGEIDWTLGDGLGTAPAVGERYLIQYHAHPRYIVRTIPFNHRSARHANKRAAPVVKQAAVRVDATLEWLL